MQLLNQALLLFALNLLDAVLTIYWVKNGIATEGNQLMARLLEVGYLPFLLVKIAVGGVAAIVLWRFSNFRLAKIGLIASLAIYIALMGVHLITGLSAAGVLSDSAINGFAVWSHKTLAFLY